MHEDILRDARTMASAVLDMVERKKKKDRGVRTEEAFAAYLSLQDCVDFLVFNGVRQTVSKGLFFPRRFGKENDGKLFMRKGGSVTCICMCVLVDDKWKLAALHCTKVTTDRGFGYVCSYVDATRGSKRAMNGSSINGDVAFLIKDHAIRRAIERSPIKDYDLALGMILWAVIKADRVEKERFELSFALGKTDFEVRAANCCYTSYGKIVGTRMSIRFKGLFRKDERWGERQMCAVVNTYLSDDMEA